MASSMTEKPGAECPRLRPLELGFVRKRKPRNPGSSLFDRHGPKSKRHPPAFIPDKARPHQPEEAPVNGIMSIHSI